MKKVIYVFAILIVFACSKSDSNSNSGSGLITMKTPSGSSYSSSNITRVLQTTTGAFFFNADPFDTYRKFYFFSGSFDINNDLILEINLNGTNSITTTNSNSEVTINNKNYSNVKLVVTLTSNVYPGLIAGTYSMYDNARPTVLLCNGSFSYNAK
jgi:hypothetical protein